MSRGRNFEIVIAVGAFGGQEDDPAVRRGLAEFFPRGVEAVFHLIDIIHAGLADFALVPREAAGLDNMQLCAHAGAKAHGGAYVLGDVGLVEGDGGHGDPWLSS